MTATHHGTTPTEHVLAVLSSEGRKPKRNGSSGWVACCPCPTHGKGRGDRNASLSVSEGREGNAVLFCHAGCDTRDVLDALRLEPSDLFADDGRRHDNVTPLRSWKIPQTPTTSHTPEACTDSGCRRKRQDAENAGYECVARYTYTRGLEAEPVGVVHRWEHPTRAKTFRPSTPDGNGGWKMSGSIPPIPYAVQRVVTTLTAGGTVLIVEGEKDADTVNGLGLADLCATTNAGGAKKWREEHSRVIADAVQIAGGTVVVVGDNDDPGRQHAEAVAESLTAAGVTPTVVYPTRGKDLTEHLQNGGRLSIGGDPDGLREPATYPRLGRVLSLEDLDNLPPIRWGVEGWVSSPSAVLLVGGYAIGKSAVTLSMACSVASGTPFLGHDVEMRRVLYVMGEGSYGLPRRVQAWKQIWGRDLPPGSLRFMTKPGGSLRERETWKDLRAFCRDEGIGMVVLDTFSSLAPEADETKDAPVIVAGLNALAETIDGTALLVHHPGWSQAAQDRARGSYALEANVDEVLILSAIAEGTEHISAKIKKRKDGESGGLHYLRRLAVHLNGPDGRPAYDTEGRPVTAVTVEHAALDDATVPTRARILGYLDACGDFGATPAEIADQIGAQKGDGSFKKALRTLESLGEIRGEGHTSRRRYFLGGDT